MKFLACLLIARGGLLQLKLTISFRYHAQICPLVTINQSSDKVSIWLKKMQIYCNFSHFTTVISLIAEKIKMADRLRF